MSDLAGVPSFRAGLRADLAQLLTQVTPENVMQMHHALQAEARRMGDDLWKYGRPYRVGLAAEDPVSEPAASGFNGKIDQTVAQTQVYVDEMQSAANQLVIIAQRYGHSEQEIKNSFARFDPNAPHAGSPGGLGR